MLENSTPVAVKGFLGDAPRAITNSSGTPQAAISISVSHYAGKDEAGKSQYKTEWVEAMAFDSEFDKTASILLNSGEYQKGTPVVAILENRPREATNLYYKDKNGQMQAITGLQPSYRVDAIGKRAYEKRGEGQGAARNASQATSAPAQTNASAPAASDTF